MKSKHVLFCISNISIYTKVSFAAVKIHEPPEIQIIHVILLPTKITKSFLRPVAGVLCSTLGIIILCLDLDNSILLAVFFVPHALEEVHGSK